MKVVIKPGETLFVEFEDTDGEVQISYDGVHKGHLTVEVDLPDSSGRKGIIYDEHFGAELPAPCPACESPEKWGDQHAPWCRRIYEG